MPSDFPLPPIALLGAPNALARSMAHALEQAWRRHAPDSPWQCLAPQPDDRLDKALALYLLGIEWQAQPALTDGAAAAHQRWRERLHAESLDYVVLYGSPARQWQQLAQSLRTRAPGADWSWLPAGPAQASGRLRPWGCEQCSDPDCERRLFDALRRGQPRRGQP